MYAGKPRFGILFDAMKISRAHLKLALRYCKQNEASLRANAQADSLSAKDYNSFWKHISKASNNNASKYTNVIDGCIGDDAIADRWRVFYELLYNDSSAVNLQII